jgi:hypothetical protein
MVDDIVLEAISKGNIKATMQMGGELTHTTITQLLHVPKMKNSLISVSKFVFEGFKVEFDKDGCKVNDVQGNVVVETRRDKNLYLLNVNVCCNSSFGLATKAKGLQGCELRGSLGVKARGSPGVTSHTPGSVRSAREYEE